METFKVEFFSEEGSLPSSYTVLAKSHDDAAVLHSYNTNLKPNRVYVIKRTNSRMFKAKLGGFKIFHLSRLKNKDYAEGLSITYVINEINAGN